jgi:hypothetical protein
VLKLFGFIAREDGRMIEGIMVKDYGNHIATI